MSPNRERGSRLTLETSLMTTRTFHRLFIPITLAFLLLGNAHAQGSGDLPPLPKAKATPKPKTATPKPKTASTSNAALRREPAQILPIAFNQSAEGRLNAQASGRISATSFYDEYALTASSADIFTIQLQAADPNLAVQVFTKDEEGLPILKDPRTGEFRLDTPGGTLPDDGEYRVRVQGILANNRAEPIAYTLKINRTGLTDEGYAERLEQIISAFNTPGSKNVDETIAKLEQLTRDAPNKPEAYERLGVIHLYHRNDLTKAVGFMEQAIKLGGAAIFQVTHDSQWRKPSKQSEREITWKEARTSWLHIRPGQIELKDSSEAQQTLFSSGSQQIRDLSRSGSSAVIEIKQTGGGIKQRFLAPTTKNPAEADTIINLIKIHVLRKG
jgi:hypothetical protein